MNKVADISVFREKTSGDREEKMKRQWNNAVGELKLNAHNAMEEVKKDPADRQVTTAYQWWNFLHGVFDFLKTGNATVSAECLAIMRLAITESTANISVLSVDSLKRLHDTPKTLINDIEIDPSPFVTMKRYVNTGGIREVKPAIDAVAKTSAYLEPLILNKRYLFNLPFIAVIIVKFLKHLSWNCIDCSFEGEQLSYTFENTVQTLTVDIDVSPLQMTG